MRFTRLLFVALLLTPSAFAQVVGSCEVAEASATLEGGDVRAQLYNNGGLFWRSSGFVYTVPKDGSANALFNAGLWVGGLDDDDALRFAGTTYGPFEYWPGPLDIDGNPPDDCSAFDRIYTVTQAEIDAYDADGTLADDLRDWPADLGAPVTDGDGTPGNYDLAAGDRPALEGSMIAWWVMNDVGNAKGSSKTSPIGLEVRVTAHAYDTDPTVADPTNPSRTVYPTTTVYDYEIVHKGGKTLTDTYVGFWMDPDLGDASDDFIGSDSLLHMGYVYNGRDFDGGRDGYGATPPALGITVLKSPHTGDSEGKLSSFVRHDKSGTPRQQVYYRLIRGLLFNGQPIREGGSGLGEGPITTFMYSGAAEDRAYWSEENRDRQGTPNTSADRRSALGSGPFTMAPGDIQRYRIAIVWARGAGRLASVRLLKDHVRYVRDIEAGREAQLPASRAPREAPSDLELTYEARDASTASQFSWAPVDRAVRYRVEIDDANDDSFVTPMTWAVTQTRYSNDSRLMPNRLYAWRVRGESSFEIGPWSPKTLFATDIDGRPRPLSEDFAFASVYPNPADQAAMIAVDSPSDARIDIEVYDVLGRRVMRTQGEVRAGFAQAVPVDVRPLAPGLYLYRIEARSATEDAVDTWSSTGRFIVAR